MGKTELGRTYWRVRGLAAPLLGQNEGLHIDRIYIIPHAIETIMNVIWIAFGWDAKWIHTAQEPGHGDFKAETDQAISINKD